MPSDNSKYSQEMRERTARHILETGKSATSMAEELGIGVDTVCRWVRDYRRAHGMPSYAEARGTVRREPKTEGELVFRVKELEKELKKKERELADEREKVEIQKNPAHLYAATRMKCEAIFAHSSGYSARKMCKVPGLREAVYCRWKKAEERRNRRIREEREDILAVKEDSGENRRIYEQARTPR